MKCHSFKLVWYLTKSTQKQVLKHSINCAENEISKWSDTHSGLCLRKCISAVLSKTCIPYVVDNFCSLGYILRICMWRLHQIKPSWRLRSGQNVPFSNPTPIWPRWSPNALHHKGVCYLVISRFQEISKSNVSAF